jgi:hypothetical protein
LWIISIKDGDIDVERLSKCQRDADQGLYAQAISAYVCWLAGRIETIQKQLPDDICALRDVYRQQKEEVEHARTFEIRANLAIGWKTFLQFAQEVGAISEEEAKTHWQHADVGLLVAARSQLEHQRDADPVARFLKLLASAIFSGRAHVVSPCGNRPDDAEQWGWREEEVAGKELRQVWKPQGKKVGWIDGDDLFLNPDASFAAAQELAEVQGESIPRSPKMLSKLLNEQKKLRSTGDGRIQSRRTLESNREDVWHIAAKEVMREK